MTINYIDIKSTGYIRSNCWSKIQYLFEGMHVTALSLKRSRNEKEKRKQPHPWLKAWLYATGHLKMEWDFWKHKVPFAIAKRDFEKLVHDYNFRDFSVSKIEVGLREDAELVKMINNKLKSSYPADTIFYVTYKSSPLAYADPDQVNVKPIHKINEIAIRELGFKVSVMDLASISTHNKDHNKLNGVLLDHDIIWKIIREHINHDRWFQLPEIQQLKEKTYPGAIRTYELRKGSTFVLVNDEEVR